jgi:hypothetical protein
MYDELGVLARFARSFLLIEIYGPKASRVADHLYECGIVPPHTDAHAASIAFAVGRAVVAHDPKMSLAVEIAGEPMSKGSIHNPIIAIWLGERQ